MSTALAIDFERYGLWRNGVAERIIDIQSWLAGQELNDAETDLRLRQLLDKLNEDRLNVAFVAEFSRGKSELINAIFFADYHQRVLPSSAGRTTMCPTELFYEADSPPSIRLLPIETKMREGTVSDFKRHLSEWTEFPLDVHSAEQLTGVMARLAQTTHVSEQVASEFGLYDPNDEEARRSLAKKGTLEIPRWRHALINFPHPLLEQGLVILDTPGLNAIGTEPELTLSLLPNAHAVLFLLAADTGVTKSDIEIWRHHIASVQSGSQGRLVVLNKIDGLWDELKTPQQVDLEIARQVAITADQLDLSADQIYPVSAQKALLAKIRHDDALLERSRLPALEAALSGELIPCKQDLVRSSTEGAIVDVVVKTTELLEARLAGMQDQIDELETLRGKNRDVVAHMMTKANQEKETFERGLVQFQALKNVFASQASVLQVYLGMDTLRSEVRKTRTSMESSAFSWGLSSAMEKFFQQVRGNMDKAGHQADEIQTMMKAMYFKFSEEHGLAAVSPPEFSLLRFQKELQRLERIFDERFNNFAALIRNGQYQLTARFFETLASKVVQVFEIANRETVGWLKALMAPMETQVREHHMQLKRRLESVQRIHAATETLDERIRELAISANTARQQIEELAGLNQRVLEALSRTMQTAQPLAQRA
ncbi:MAG TPA: dynamin family protein [Thiobacillaceae bacterium]|nr:dynamin family protein [Thiobacillaceae bacterium]